MSSPAKVEGTSTRKVKKPGFLGCCCGSIEEVALEVQMTAAAFKAPPPLKLEHGYANEEGEARGMAPPRCGCFEVVNKNKEGEIIAVLVAENAAEVAVKGRDVHGHLPAYMRLMPDVAPSQPAIAISPGVQWRKWFSD